ncbi:hypothetical protein L2E82_12457 [Cichorium intybus]|uniref:Uncharacterized protein n=1 Tax=Cichorium intybus TaxID=13427 RepID=A0ACB9GI40_CICIN|nr:hypothetical protein L2E82_12457 [Cichorium intybus]
MQSSRSLIQRVAPIFAARIRLNARLLSSTSSSALAKEPQSSSPSPSVQDSVYLSDNCVRRMKELQADEAKEKLLRLSIEAGGCSGFQYNFALEDKPDNDDRIFERDGVKLVVDTISLGFVKGATVDYVEELIRSGFQVAENPSAVGGCSCKSSFMTLDRYRKCLGFCWVAIRSQRNIDLKICRIRSDSVRLDSESDHVRGKAKESRINQRYINDIKQPEYESMKESEKGKITEALKLCADLDRRKKTRGRHTLTVCCQKLRC